MNHKSGVGRGMDNTRDVLRLDCQRRSQEVSTVNSGLRQPSASFQIVGPEQSDRAGVGERNIGGEKRNGEDLSYRHSSSYSIFCLKSMLTRIVGSVLNRKNVELITALPEEVGARFIDLLLKSRHVNANQLASEFPNRAADNNRIHIARVRRCDHGAEGIVRWIEVDIVGADCNDVGLFPRG